MKKRCAERNEQLLHNVTQTRNKFKKLMNICKAALLTQKTASRIKRFQNQKEYGQWFDVLVLLMKTKVSCQPEQAIEPSAGESGVSSLDPESSVGSDVTVDTVDQDILDGLPDMTKSRSRSAPDITSDSSNKSIYVPVKSWASGKTSIFKRIETTNSQISNVLCQIKTVLEDEKKFKKRNFRFFERENECAHQHELDLFRIMFQSNGVQQAPRTAQQPRAAAIHDQHPQLATVQHPPAVGVQQIPTTTAH